MTTEQPEFVVTDSRGIRVSWAFNPILSDQRLFGFALAVRNFSPSPELSLRATDKTSVLDVRGAVVAGEDYFAKQQSAISRYVSESRFPDF